MSQSIGPQVIETEEAVKVYFPSERNKWKRALFGFALVFFAILHRYYLNQYELVTKIDSDMLPIFYAALFVTGNLIAFAAFQLLFQFFGYEELVMKGDETFVRKGIGSIFFIQFHVEKKPVTEDADNEKYPFALETGGYFNSPGEGRFYVSENSGRRLRIGRKVQFNQAREIATRVGKYKGIKKVKRSPEYMSHSA